jgi:hypothetical protein
VSDSILDERDFSHLLVDEPFNGDCFLIYSIENKVLPNDKATNTPPRICPKKTTLRED